jgi:hypothetical protein
MKGDGRKGLIMRRFLDIQIFGCLDNLVVQKSRNPVIQ